MYKYPSEINGSLAKTETAGVDRLASFVPSRVQKYCSLYVLDIQKSVFIIRTIQHQNKLLSEVVVSVPAGFRNLVAPSPEQPALCSWLTLLWAGGWTRDLSRALPRSVLLWSCSMILYSDTSNGVHRYIRIYCMGWGWNLLPIAMLMLVWPHKSYTLSELQLMPLQCGNDSSSLFPWGICKHSIKFSNYSYSKWCSTVSQDYSKCNISISPWSNTKVNFGTKHRHILGNVLLNLIKLTKYQPADQIQSVN